MPAVGEAHPEQRAAGLGDGEIGREVGRRARVRLHVGVVGLEQPPDALERQILRHVHELAAAVVALAREPLRVLVVHHRAQRLQHRVAGEVLRGDQLQRLDLAAALVGDGLEDLGIAITQLGHGAYRFWRWVDSYSVILASRATCRPPSNGVSSQMRIQRTASSCGLVRPPRASTLESLCSRVKRAVSSLVTTAARTPATLLAAIASPIPLPPSTMPRSARPSATRSATGKQ